MAVATKRKSEMTSYLNSGYDVMNYFAKFEKFIPDRITIPSSMTVGSQMPELDRGGGGGFPHKMGSQNIPYKLGLTKHNLDTPTHARDSKMNVFVITLASS